MAKTTPNQRTLQALRQQGYTVEVTEHWNQFARKRHDLFGFIDALAIDGGGFLAVQSTSRSNTSARVKKIKTECRDKALAWLEAGGRIEVWGWGKLANSRSWEPRIVALTIHDLRDEI